jgi:hypothetical protein
MILIPEAQRIVLEQIRPLGTEQVDISAALGRVLAATITAPDALPPFPASIKVHWAGALQDAGTCNIQFNSADLHSTNQLGSASLLASLPPYCL